MNILSLFDGISCGMVALERANIKVGNYYAAEIDKYAQTISAANYPEIKRLGDVTKWQDWSIDWTSIDLVLAGFPCQAWSMAGQQQGDKDPRGALFWTTLDIIKNVKAHNPNAKFLMENVKMKKEFEDYITFHTEQALGYVEKTLINSALVSAQNRNRFYWTNFPVTQPKDKGILLKDIVEDEPCGSFDVNPAVLHRYTFNGKPKGFKKFYEKSNCLTASMHKGFGNDGCTIVKCGAIRGRYIVDGKRQDHKMLTAGLTEQRLELRKDDKTNTLTTVQKDNVLVYENKEIINQSATKQGKAYCLTANYMGAWAKNSVERKQRTMIPVGFSNEKKVTQVHNGVLYRKLTPLECERLQTLPDNYTAHVSNTQRYKSIGNGWTVDVIAHIFKCMK